MRDLKITRLLLFVFLFSSLAAAQFTLVSATVVDPNGTPYALGNVSAQVVTAGVTPTLNGLGFSMSSGPANLSATGSFTMSLVSSTAMVPNLPWLFTVCSGAGTILPAGGVGPVCFTSSITITGATQNISATLSAAAPAISVAAGAASAVNSPLTFPNTTTIKPKTGTALALVTPVGTTLSIGTGGGTSLGLDTPIPGGFRLQDAANNDFVQCFTNVCDLEAVGATGQINLTASADTIQILASGGGISGGTGTVQWNVAGGLQATTYLTNTNCGATGTAASPSVVSCVGAAAGAFSCAVAASGTTCVVNTTAVTANSEIFIEMTTSESARLGVTCNNAPTAVPAVLLSTKAAASGFTLVMPTIITNPLCFDYHIVN